MVRRLVALVTIIALGTAVATAAAGTPIRSVGTCPDSYLYYGLGGTNAQWQGALLCLINGARKAEGLPALSQSGQLNGVAQHQTDTFAATGNGSHGASLSDIAKRFEAAGYRPAAYNEAFDLQGTNASPYAFLWDMLSNSEVDCQELLDPRMHDIGIGIAAAKQAPYDTLALEFGLRAGQRQPSTNEGPRDSCLHKIAKPAYSGSVLEPTGNPSVTTTTLTVALRCVTKVPCLLTTHATLPAVDAKSAVQQITIPGHSQKTITYTFAAGKLASQEAKQTAAEQKYGYIPAQDGFVVWTSVTSPAQYTASVAAELPPLSS